jgi:hypothetical protein
MAYVGSFGSVAAVLPQTIPFTLWSTGGSRLRVSALYFRRLISHRAAARVAVASNVSPPCFQRPFP